MLVAKKEFEVYPQYEEHEIPRKKNSKDIKENNKKNSKKQLIIKIKLFTFAIVSLLFSLTILFRYTQITQLESDIRKLDQSIVRLNKEKQELEINLEKIYEVKWIEKEAIEKLGMVYPSNKQIIYLSVESEIEEKMNDGQKKFLLRVFDNIKEVFIEQ